jgi:hypothetical protein
MKRLSLVTVVLVATVVGADSRGLTAGAVAAGPITFSLGQAVPVGLVFGVTTADFNGDGHLDLAATNSVFSGTGVQVFLGAGDGTFSGGTHYPTGVCATPVTARDLNRDGRPDIVVGNNTGGATTGGMTIADQVNLTADPFVNGAAGNFALNTAPGGGALVRGAGLPGTFPGLLARAWLDGGAVQHRDTGQAFTFIS